MTKENGPVVSELKSLKDIPSGKKAFVLVGDIIKNSEVAAMAAKKKAFLSFFYTDKLENVEENTLVSINDQTIGEKLNMETDKENLEEFIKKYSYPRVGQLGPENYQFYLDRGLDMLWVGLSLSDNLQENVDMI